jgi:hypothetical protein
MVICFGFFEGDAMLSRIGGGLSLIPLDGWMKRASALTLS